MAGCCKSCGKKLRADEIAVYRRLVDREARGYLCADCLAAYFHCPPSLIEEKIRYFKGIGCLLFAG